MGVFLWARYPCRALGLLKAPREVLLLMRHANPLNTAVYRGYSKLRTHTALGSYGRAISRSIGPP